MADASNGTPVGTGAIRTCPSMKRLDIGLNLPCGCHARFSRGKLRASFSFCSDEHARRLWMKWDHVVQCDG
ncbi:MAG: hypothetical protein ACODAA_00905 [Gemmatimonadota bacterium]